MSISLRFFFSYFDVAEVGKEYKIGDHKHEMTDDQLSRILHVSGGHQRMLSVSRCYRLTDKGFRHLSLATSMWFLDISYTSCVDLAPLVACKFLRSLNISGLAVSNYDSLGLIPSLELLSASFSGIASTAPLSALTNLRALNLGFTQVQDISGIRTCTRLEELLLDCSKVDSAEEVAKTLTALPQLRLLGIGETSLMNESRALKMAMPRGAVMHTLSSTYYWFKAIIENDAPRVREIMTLGYDINSRPTTEDVGPLMAHAWTSRCAAATICFDVFHPQESMRPRGVHLAIFFSSVDALKLLVGGMADMGGDVWIGSVLADPERTNVDTARLIQNEKKNRANNSEAKSAFAGGGKKNGIAFCKKIYDCNIHRFTEGMQKKRIRSWKDLCEQHMKRMIAIINGEPDPGPPISREDRRLLEKGLSSQALLLSPQSSFELNGELDAQNSNEKSRSYSENEPFEVKSQHQASADEFDGLTTQNLDDFTLGGPRGEVSDMMAHWNRDAIVGRLHQPVRIADSRGSLPMLGPRSFFEESYAQTVRKNVREDEIQRAKAEAWREELRLNPKLAKEEADKALDISKTTTSLNSLAGKDKGSVYYIPEGKEVISAMKPDDLKRTIKERKELFYKLIKKKKSDTDDESDTEVVN